MDDSWSPSPSQAGMYWSVEQCRWVQHVAPEVPAEAVPQQRPEPAAEPLPS